MAQTTKITIQALNGKTAKPLIHQRLLIFGGKTKEETKFHRTHFDVTTDSKGVAELEVDRSTTLWFTVFADFMTVCDDSPNLHSFSIDSVLSAGVSEQNNCSSFRQKEMPGVFTIFARPATFRERMAW